MNDDREKVMSAATGANGRAREDGDSSVLVQQLRDSRRAALNLMEDAVQAREEAERAVDKLQESEARLAEELADVRQLQEISTALVREEDVDILFAQILDVAINLMQANVGSLEMVDRETGDLKLIASKGFHPDSKRYWEVVGQNPGVTCGIAMESRERLIVADVENCDFIRETEDLKHFRLSKIRALQSTPLIARAGKIVGVISTHWNKVNEPSERSLRALDVLARQAADLIERVQAEEIVRQTTAQLRETTELFFGLIENAPFGVYLVDSDFRLVQVSAAAQKVFENVHPLIGRDFEEVIRSIWDDPFAAEAIRRFRNALESGEEYHSELTTETRADISSVESYDWQIKRITLPDETYGVVCYFFDLTERRRAEKALRWSEERLRLLTESFKDFAIFTADTQGNVTSWNPGAEKIFLWRDSEILGQHSRILFVPEDQATGEAENEMETALAQGRAADERWHLRKDGSRFYASGIMAPLHDGEAHIGFAKIARDLTEQKQAAEELRRQHEELEAIVAGRTAELEEANAALREQMVQRQVIEEERFGLLQRIVTTQEDERRRIARDMHDSLGQQLTALRLKIASLKDAHPDDKRLGESLEHLQHLGAKVDSEVNFLVWELRPTVLDDLGLVAAIQAYTREWSRHYDISIEVHTARFAKDRLETDVETNLYRILQEALNNTFKHSKATGVNVMLESRHNHVVLVVEDDGVGFDPDNVKINPDTGRGLGLIGIRERAAIIGGKVEIESSPGNGTTIFVRIPLGEGD